MALQPSSPTGRWQARRPTKTEAAEALFLYTGLSFVFAGVVTAIELLGGAPARPMGFPFSVKNELDAVWHLGTGIALAWPVASRRTALLSGLINLGIDIDHVFGSLFPADTIRTSHDVFFVMIAAGVLYRLLGSGAALIAVGAFLSHVSLDGGSFPLVGPVSTASWALPSAVSLLLVAVSAVFIFLAIRPARDLLKRRSVASVGVVVAVVELVFLFGAPWISTFNGF